MRKSQDEQATYLVVIETSSGPSYLNKMTRGLANPADFPKNGNITQRQIKTEELIVLAANRDEAIAKVRHLARFSGPVDSCAEIRWERAESIERQAGRRRYEMPPEETQALEAWFIEKRRERGHAG